MYVLYILPFLYMSALMNMKPGGISVNTVDLDCSVDGVLKPVLLVDVLKPALLVGVIGRSVGLSVCLSVCLV